MAETLKIIYFFAAFRAVKFKQFYQAGGRLVDYPTENLLAADLPDAPPTPQSNALLSWRHENTGGGNV